MKVQIIVTDKNGDTYRGNCNLELMDPTGPSDKPPKVAATRGAKAMKRAAVSLAREQRDLDFSKPQRAFVKMHAKYAPSGAKKFVLLVAYLAKGKVDVEVSLTKIESEWNRMTLLMGGKFNRFFTSSARESGWVDTRKKGVYVLCPSWHEAVTHE
jgi:hypothetical protein